MQPELTKQTLLINFLKEELAVPAAAIAVALRHNEAGSSLLPMVLLQYGLITIDQLNKVFEWMETV